MAASTDVVVVGAGIVGLATAYRIKELYPERRVTVVEKESGVARHQSGHNSGVIHSGIYYKPGSLKATTCRAGKRALESFCQEHHISWERSGKVIVATREDEVPLLREILARGRGNGVECAEIDADGLKDLEPHAVGVRALHVPEAGIVDYPAVCRRLAEILEEQGGELRMGARVTRIRPNAEGARVGTGSWELQTRAVVNCSGLHSDRLTRLSGERPRVRIIPFRGEYYELVPEARDLCRNLIYPVPDPRFPFLGVHFTRLVGGGVECGPNAVLALSREGYRWSRINLRDFLGSLTYPGFLRLARRYFRTGAGEVWRSLSKKAFVRALQRLVPEIREEMLRPAEAGVRAQAVTPRGALADDFVIQRRGPVVNVLNAPSPAATASLEIGRVIARELSAVLDSPSDRS